MALTLAQSNSGADKSGGRKSVRRTLPVYPSGYRSSATIARRGFAPEACRVLEAAESQGGVSFASSWGGTALLHLLRVMVESHPIASYAMANDLDFAFGPDVRLVAVDTRGQKDDNAEGTAAIEALWASLPREMGGLRGLLETIGSDLSITGMASVEAIPAGVGAGLLGVVTVDPLSLIAIAPDAGSLQASWRQHRLSATESAALDPITFYATSWRGSSDNPYGAPIYGGAFRDLVSDFGEQQGLGDVMRAVAWPHLVFEFAFKPLMDAAESDPEILAGGKDNKGNPLTPYTFAKQEFNKFQDILPGLLADDSILMPETNKSTSPVSVVNAGANLDGALNATVRRALRISQGMNHPPSMVNLSLGGTQAYFVEDFKRHCRKLERRRSKSLEVAMWIAQTHLRLLGMNLLVETRAAPIYTEDALRVAQARALTITAEMELGYAGVIDPNESSMNLTQTPLFDVARWEDGRKRWLGAPGAATVDTTDTAADDESGDDNAN